MLQIVAAIEFLHADGYVHRDIKPENILVKFAGRNQTLPIYKLGDFGLADQVDAYDGCARSQCGTPDYMAPEIHLGKAYQRSVDIFALGVVLFELLSDSLPIRGRDEYERRQCIVKNTYKRLYPKKFFYPWAERCHFQLTELVSDCMAYNPSHRPSARKCQAVLSELYVSGGFPDLPETEIFH
uniref:Protein kinase domain-containing protein n=1 Tax=Panagrolaimus sp. ES5 TaxID=591445 RepID=A0AC34G900_9BILA